MSGNRVEYGIRINVDGAHAASDAVAQVKSEFDRLSSAASQNNTSLQGSAVAHERVVGQLNAESTALSQVTNATNRLTSSTASMGQATEAAAAAQSRGAEQARGSQTALADATRQSNVQTDNATRRQRALRDEISATGRPLEQLGTSARQTAAAMRLVPAQFTDIVTQLQGGQNPFTVLLQQGGQLRDSFGSVGAAARGMGSYILSLVSPATIAAAALATLAVAWHQASAEQSAFAQTLITTGNRIGTTSAQMSDMAANISKSVGTQANAASALNDMAAGGRVAASSLENFTRVAVQMERTTGQSVRDTAAELADLARDPLEASQKLNDRYNYLTASVYAHIKALKDQGEADKAGAAAQAAYMEAWDKRSAELSTKLTTLAKRWQEVKDAAGGAWGTITGLFRDETPSAELVRVRRVIALKQQSVDQRTASGESNSVIVKQLRAELEVLRQQEASLQGQVGQQQQVSAAAAAAADKEEAKLKWIRDGERFLTRQKQFERDEEAIRKAGKAANVDDSEVEKRVARLRQQYSDLDNVTVAANEAQRAVEKERISRSIADLESLHKRQLVSDGDFIRQRRDLQLKDLASEEVAVQKQAELAKGKPDLAERTKYLGQLRVIQERRKTIIQDADNQLQELSRAATKAIEDQSRAWDNATATERAALSDEVELFGKAGEARKIAVEQLKVDAEVRQLVANWLKQGHTLSEQERSDLEKSALARKASIAAIMGERQALAGAEELRQENRKFAASMIADDESRADRLLQIDASVWRERIALAGEGTAAQQRLQEQFDEWYANRQMTPVLERWKGIVNNLDSDFRQGFRGMLEHGHDAFSSFAASIGNTLKTTLADVLYQTFVKKYVLQVVTSLAGIFSGPQYASALNGGGGNAVSPDNPFGVASSNSSASERVSAAETASSLYKAMSSSASAFGDSLVSSIGRGITSLGDSFGSSAVSSFGKGMQGFGLDGSLGSAAGYGQTAASILGRVGGTVGGYMLGSQLNSAISGQYETASGMMTAQKIATAVASYVAGPVGGAVAGAISGLWNRAFGMGDKKVTSEGMRGTITADSLTGTKYADWHQDGGWFRSDRNGTDLTAISDSIVKQFTSGLSALERASAGFASSLGVQADWLKSYSKTFDIKLSGDAEKDAKAVEELFAGIGDEIANRLIPNLGEFARSGEAAASTLERLSQTFQGTDRVAQLLGTSATAMFGSVGLASAEARQRLVDLAGGVDVLSQQAQFFAQNFLTEEQRIAPVKQAVDAAMESLGHAGVRTREAFKAIVDGLDKTSASGAEQFIALMRLQEAFAQVYPATEAATQAIKEQTQAVVDQAQVFRDMQGAAAAALGNVDSSMNVLQRVVDREKAALKATHDAQLKAIESQIAVATTAQQKFKALSQTLRSALDSMRVSPQPTATQRAAAQAQIQSALAIAKAGGPLPDADSLKNALSTLGQDASDLFETYQDYQRDFYTTQNSIADLAQYSDDALSVAERSLEVLNQQRDAVNAAYEAQVNRLDKLVEDMRAEVDESKGQSTLLLSIVDAVNAVRSAILSANSNPLVAGTASINQAYQTALHRAPDAAGLDFWQQRVAAGVSATEVVDAITKSTEAQVQQLYTALLGRSADAAGLAFWMKQAASGVAIADIRSAILSSTEYGQAPIPGFAVGGHHGGGWRIVGENGPELEATGPARIFNASDTASILGAKSGDDAGVKDEVRALREETEGFREDVNNALYAIAKYTMTTKDIQEKWDQIGMPSVRTA